LLYFSEIKHIQYLGYAVLFIGGVRPVEGEDKEDEAVNEAEKKKVKKPAAIPSNLQEDMVYPNNIQIIDGNQITWYEIDKSTAMQIHAAISAN
jgi:hypothetical protein